jgi:hypothetical protein
MCRGGRGNVKDKYSFMLAVCFLVSLVFLGANQSQNPQWKGTIEEEDGVKVIKNPREPLYGEITFDLEEDLSIGNETDDNYLFYTVLDIDVDSDNNIYVVDERNFRIQEFDKSGKYLRTIGRKGQGPGEFELPIGITVDNNLGNILVIDHRASQIEIFNSEGEYIKSFKVRGLVEEILPIAENYLIVHSRGRTHKLSRVSPQDEIISILAEKPHNIFLQRVRGGAAELSVTTYHELSIFMAKINEESLVYGYSKNYELNVINNEGKILYKITKNAPIPKYSEKEKSKFEKYPLPEPKPYFYWLLVDSKERIYVQRNNCYGNIKVEVIDKKVDVFSKEGYYLFSTTLPPNTRVIRDGWIYCFERNEDEGWEHIIRYKIKNWEQIKTGF